MWFDCGNVLINLDHVDYVQFEETETETETAKATVYFASGDSLDFGHSDINVLKKHFRKVLEAKNNE